MLYDPLFVKIALFIINEPDADACVTQFAKVPDDLSLVRFPFITSVPEPVKFIAELPLDKAAVEMFPVIVNVAGDTAEKFNA